MNLKNTVIICLILLISFKISGQQTKSIPILRFSQLETYLHCRNDTTYIINFWATWCVPCRKELPAFEQLYKLYSNKAVKVLLVSLDFSGQLESDLIPFLSKNNITAPVVLLNDPDSNSWINKVDSSWGGSIPATLIYRNDFRVFYEKELDYSVLDQLISKTI
jgi:thiol-disulfide isomerase/thioredoxin